MNRFLALALVAGSIVAAGCGYANYSSRLEATENRLKDEMTLNRSLAGPATGDFQTLSVYLRPPIGWTGSPLFDPDQPANSTFEDQQIAPLYDLRGSYIGPVAATKGQDAQAAPPKPPMFRFLGRRKKEPTEAEKAEGPPAQAEAPRGDFLAETLALLQTYYRTAEMPAAEAVSEDIWPRVSPPRKIDYQRFMFNGADGQLVHAYIFKDVQGTTEYDAALIFEFPDGQVPTEATFPIDKTLGTFAVGARANRLFRGDSEDSGEGGAGEAGPAVAF